MGSSIAGAAGGFQQPAYSAGGGFRGGFRGRGMPAPRGFGPFRGRGGEFLRAHGAKTVSD